MSVEVRREMLVRYLREQGRTSVNDLATTLILPVLPSAVTCDS